VSCLHCDHSQRSTSSDPRREELSRRRPFVGEQERFGQLKCHDHFKQALRVTDWWRWLQFTTTTSSAYVLSGEKSQHRTALALHSSWGHGEQPCKSRYVVSITQVLLCQEPRPSCAHPP
jgi:hypothetical protein